MADQWEEAAKQFKPDPNAAPASPAAPQGNDDWKLWRDQGGGSNGPSPTFIDRARSFGQEHPYLSTAANIVTGGLLSPLTDPTDEGAKGMLKQAGRDAYGIVSSPATPVIGTGLTIAKALGHHGIEDRVQQATEPSNDLQRAGGYGMTAGEMALPLPKGLNMIPNAARAGENFNLVQNIMKGLPVNIDAAAPSVLRAQELAKASSWRPPVMRNILTRLAPGAEQPTFREATDLGTEVGKLSSSEAQKMKGPMGGQVKQTAKALSGANQAAAEQGGVGDIYKQAVDEYRRAKAIEAAKDAAIKTAKRIAIPAAVGATGYEVYRGLMGDH